jgi:hypothetical protein
MAAAWVKAAMAKGRTVEKRIVKHDLKRTPEN